MPRWSYSAGERGRNRVRAFVHARDGRLYLEWHEGRRREYLRLPSQDRETAKRKADELAARLGQGHDLRPDHLTLAELFDIYGKERTPLKGRSQQAADRRAARNWCDILGQARLVGTLTHRDAARFTAERRRRGNQRQGGAYGRPLGARAIDHDVRSLRSALRWAVGAGLLDRNPLEGFRLQGEKNPRRPIATAPVYEAMLSKAGGVGPLFPALLTIVHETGHRIGAVRQLRWVDVDLDDRTIRWRAQTDKTGREHVTPLTNAAVDALRSARRTAGAISEWVFPSPTDAGVPVSVNLARDWWLRCERVAGIPHEPGCGFHSLRRLFATELKHVPLKDVCELGGWRSPQLVVSVYQRADLATMRTALEQRGRLEGLGA